MKTSDDDWRLLNNWVRALQTWMGIQVILLSSYTLEGVVTREKHHEQHTLGALVQHD